jgi:hypothetical protein
VVAQYSAQQFNLTDGDSVQTWPDQVGSFDATGGDPNYRDNIINGYPALEYDGSDDTLTVSDANFADISQPYTIIAVVDFTQESDGSRNPAFRGGPEPHGPTPALGGSNTGTPGWRYYAGNNFVNGTEDDSINLFTTVFDDPNNNSELREDGTQTATGSPGSNPLVELRLGTSDTDDFIGFIEIHDGLPSNGLSTREQEIADLWDITL